MIHLEGMGWFGSMLAFRLDQQRLRFTWHDTDSGPMAWRASTGLVYPSGDARAEADRDQWLRHTSGVLLPQTMVQQVSFVFTQAAPPFGGPPSATVGPGWSISSARAVQVDVPALVRSARDRFASQRSTGPAAGDLLIRAHGFTERIGAWVWGWNCPVMLTLDPSLRAALRHDPARPQSEGARPAIAARSGRFVAPYAYPLLSAPEWWRAGSSMVVQHRPRQLDAAKHFTTWRRQFTELAPFARIEAHGTPVQGWRPQAKRGDSGRPERAGDVITLPPMSHSGVRLAPSVLDQTLELL